MMGIPNKIIKPNLSNSELAYETGFHLGDGHLEIIDKKSYKIIYSGDSNEDVVFFYDILVPLMRGLYGLEPKISKDSKKNEIRLIIYSKELAIFKRNLGLPVGKKIINQIPEFINSSLEKKLNFIAGIFDSDGCIKFLMKYKDTHYYPQVRIKMKDFIIPNFVKTTLKPLDINSTLYEENVTLDGKIHSRWCLDINGKKNVSLFFKHVKPRNIKHISKYIIWRKKGCLKPRTKLFKRLDIIKNMGS